MYQEFYQNSGVKNTPPLFGRTCPETFSLTFFFGVCAFVVPSLVDGNHTALSIC